MLVSLLGGTCEMLFEDVAILDSFQNGHVSKNISFKAAAVWQGLLCLQLLAFEAGHCASLTDNRG